MKLDDIFASWTSDSTIDKTELGIESTKIPTLHAKYIKIYAQENLLFRRLTSEYKSLECKKFEYYSGKMDEDDLKLLGWDQFDKRILKQDVHRYLDADADLIKKLLSLDYQKEKVETLKSILSTINGRSFHISNAVKWHLWLNGSNV
jgi:hypothetical protein